MELRRGIIAVLRLTGQDHTSAILGEGFQILIGEKYDSGLENREQQRQKHWRDQREFDRRRSPPVTAKPPIQVSSCGCNGMRCHGNPNTLEIEPNTMSKMLVEVFS